MEKLMKLLVFLRLVNGDGYLSITNGAVIVVLIKLALTPELDLSGAAALLTVIGAYHFNKFTKRPPKSAPNAAINAEIAELKASVSKLNLGMGVGRVLTNSRQD